MKNFLFLAVLFALISLIPLFAGEIHNIDKSVSFPKTGIGALHFKAGSVVFEEIVIRNMPDPSDLEKAKNDPDDNCHPKLALGLSNTGNLKMKVKITVRLEGSDGTIYLSCDREDTIASGSNNDHTNLCWLSSMKTRDFPKVTKVHIIASVSPDI